MYSYITLLLNTFCAGLQATLLIQLVNTSINVLSVKNLSIYATFDEEQLHLVVIFLDEEIQLVSNLLAMDVVVDMLMLTNV